MPETLKILYFEIKYCPVFEYNKICCSKCPGYMDRANGQIICWGYRECEGRRVEVIKEVENYKA